MKSMTRLFAALVEISPFLHGDAVVKRLKAANLTDETYGRTSMIYIRAQSPAHRAFIINALTAQGFKVSPTYGVESNNVAVQVSYFKGYHWDE